MVRKKEEKRVKQLKIYTTIVHYLHVKDHGKSRIILKNIINFS